MRNAYSSLESEVSLEDVVASLASLNAHALQVVLGDWQIWAREDQVAPPEPDGGPSWRTWLLLGGRGAGKTRAGAEWVKAQVLGMHPPAGGSGLRIALVGETIKDVLAVMVEGVSGLLAVHRTGERPVLLASRQQLVWPNGAVAQMFSSEDPDGLRGPQFHFAWCDEVCKWRHPDRTWDTLQFALRLGDAPRQVVTTTPRPIPLLKRIMEDAGTVVDRAPTEENKEHLAPGFLEGMRRRYAGTALGRQELDAELIEQCAGALWRQDWFDELRVAAAPELTRIVVAVDPPVTATASSDACGLVVAGLGRDRRGYVLADRTLKGREPAGWARAAVAAYRDFAADRIVAEANQGGDLVESVIRQVDATVPISLVRATRGKWLRAEPVAALYAEGRVAHVGRWPELEAQMLAFGADGLAGGRSPDRLDALVWALTALMLDPRPEPGVRAL